MTVALERVCLSFVNVWPFVGNVVLILVDTSGIGLHLLRIEGASAALNSGVPEHVIKNHGRWKSDSAKELYCRENLRRQLLATSRIGL